MHTLDMVIALMLATPQPISIEEHAEPAIHEYVVEDDAPMYNPVPAPQYYQTLDAEAQEENLVSHDELQEIIADQKLRNAGFSSGSDKGISPELRADFELYRLCCWNFVMNRVAYVFSLS